MKKLLSFVILAGLVLSLTGCYVTPVMPPVGGIFNDTYAPLSIDYNKTAVAAKSGVAKTESILGAVSWGDCSTQAAAKAGGITTVESADYHFYNVMGVYQKFEVIVHGN